MATTEAVIVERGVIRDDEASWVVSIHDVTKRGPRQHGPSGTTAGTNCASLAIALSPHPDGKPQKIID
jgi:hypothetical protein